MGHTGAPRLVFFAVVLKQHLGPALHQAAHRHFSQGAVIHQWARGKGGAALVVEHPGKPIQQRGLARPIITVDDGDAATALVGQLQRYLAPKLPKVKQLQR